MGLTDWMRRMEPDAARLLKLWDMALKIPGGRMVFSKAVGRMAPYTSTVDARVEILHAGYAELSMVDRSSVRNHLGSIHAMALANFGEEVTGLALLTALPEGGRGIVTRFEVEYLKKARGLLTAQCEAPAIHGLEAREMLVEGTIKDASDDVVARIKATWRIGGKA